MTRSQTRKINSTNQGIVKSIKKSTKETTIEKTAVSAIFYRFRCIVKIAPGTWYYKSTGLCSGCPDTWFPCLGIVKNHPLTPGYIIKPNVLLIKGLPWGFVFDQFVKRFGSIDQLAISCKVGGGYWNSEASLKLREWLKTTAEYKKDHSAIINQIKNLPKDIPDLDIDETVEYFRN